MIDTLNLKIENLEKNLRLLENLHASFDYIKISIASAERIQNWAERILPNGISYGKILRPDTINFKTHKPEDFGLFCQKIFGPIKKWQCACGKYSNYSFKNMNKICEKCLVEITDSRMRRYRMGYIELISPVAHYWYFKGVPNYSLILLKSHSEKITSSHLEQILYFKEGSRIISANNPLMPFFSKRTPLEILFLKNLVSNKKSTPLLKQKNILFKEIPSSLYGHRVGAEILRSALEAIPLVSEISKIRTKLHNLAVGNLRTNKNFDKSLIKRLRILENFLATKTNPSWMILTNIPVLPPTLRPLMELENGKLVAADVNEIYRLIITRNQRLFDFLYKYEFPNFLSIYGRKLLQEAIDSLIDNSKVEKNKKLLINNKPLKSLSETLEGKYGRFRYSLLGKRVDYSGRSIIIVNPILRLNQCGIPYDMAFEIFQPFLINELMKLKEFSFSKKKVTLFIKQRKAFLWPLLEKLIKNYDILLNRAPTLHRLGIQSFTPILVLGQTIHLHPSVCAGFNADFDGDQMAIHLPLAYKSQMEAKYLMRPSMNILSPANGKVILKPTQDVVIGCYYLTHILSDVNFKIKNWFANKEEALHAFYQRKISLQESIFIYYEPNDLNICIKNKVLFIGLKFLPNFEMEKLIVYKKLRKKNDIIYLFSNLGILIIKNKTKNVFVITGLLLKTTVGRLILTLNIKNIQF